MKEKVLADGGEDRHLFFDALKLGHLTHLAYDCPKKHSAKPVLAAARKLLHRNGCNMSSERVTWGRAAEALRQHLPPLTLEVRRRPWEVIQIHQFFNSSHTFGSVWCPQKEIVLGYHAGLWSSHIFRAVADEARRQAGLSWRHHAKTCPLLEISLLLLRKLKSAGFKADAAFAERIEALQAVVQASRQGRQIETVLALLKSGLL